jgi:hypothetical protein
MPDGSGSPDNSDCKRVRISSLIDMPGETANFECFDLFESGSQLLDAMRSCGMDTANRNKMLNVAFDMKNVGALKRVIELLQESLADHPAGPAAAVPSPPVHDVPAPAPRANSAPPVDPVIRPPPKRRRRAVQSVARCSHGSNGEPQEAFLEIFSRFAFEYGREQFQRDGHVHLISNSNIFAAFRASHPSYAEDHPSPPFFIPKKIDPYFSRSAWLAAVLQDDASLFLAKRQLTPVQLASTIQEKMDLRPDIRPCIDWCVAWLRSQPDSWRRSSKLANAYEEARKQAEAEVRGTNAKPSSPFDIKYPSLLSGCNLSFHMLLKYAELGDDAMAEGAAELEDSDTVNGFGSDQDSHGPSDLSGGNPTAAAAPPPPPPPPPPAAAEAAAPSDAAPGFPPKPKIMLLLVGRFVWGTDRVAGRGRGRRAATTTGGGRRGRRRPGSAISSFAQQKQVQRFESLLAYRGAHAVLGGDPCAAQAGGV